MEHIREYLLTVTAASIFCGILKSFMGETGSAAGMVRLLCGVFLALTVIRPLADIQLSEWDLFPQEIQSQVDIAVAEGEDYGKQALARCIKEESEAYILDKAQAFQGIMAVEVTVNGEPPVPTECTIRGDISPYAKQQISKILEADLGIAKEDQRWIYESSN